MTQRRALILVDDERVVLDSLRLQIGRVRSTDFDIECADSVDEAWEVIAALHDEGVTVPLVMSDWLMPGTRGDAFLEQVRARLPDTHRVLLTGQADGEALRRVHEAGLVDRLLFKPWSEEDILDVVALIERWSAAGGELVR